MPRIRNSGVLSVVAFMVERLGEIIEKFSGCWMRSALKLLAARRIDGDADVLHVLAVFLRGYHHLVEGVGTCGETRIAIRGLGGNGQEQHGQRQTD